MVVQRLASLLEAHVSFNLRLATKTISAQRLPRLRSRELIHFSRIVTKK